MIRLPRAETSLSPSKITSPVHLNLRGGKSFCYLLPLICSCVSRLLNAQLEHDGPRAHSCDWIKTKNPAAPAVRREAEEDWGKGRWR